MLEGSVTGAATKLNKTPSAISHTLAPLREQVGDPLMVKVGRRMQASPFALKLIEDIRPILSASRRVLQLPAPFDPMCSARSFRIACPISAKTLSGVVSKIQHSAPNINIEWLGAPPKIYEPTRKAFSIWPILAVTVGFLMGSRRHKFCR